jgi:methylated-DNA-protein-cysteine methyltransferase-like protein
LQGPSGWGGDRLEAIPRRARTAPRSTGWCTGWSRRVPRGKVVTYGQVAAILGQPRAARAVGWPSALRPPLLLLVPWQRVINAAGRCSHRDGLSAATQRDLLERRACASTAPARSTCAHPLEGPRREWVTGLRHEL